MEKSKPAQALLPDWSADLQSWISVLLFWASQKTRAEFEQALEPLGIDSRHFGTLLVVAREGPLTQIDIARKQGIDRTTMVGLVDFLEKHALAERQAKPNDRRSYQVLITAKGQALLGKALAIAQASEESFLAALNERERKQLRALLSKLL